MATYKFGKKTLKDLSKQKKAHEKKSQKPAPWRITKKQYDDLCAEVYDLRRRVFLLETRGPGDSA